MSGKKIKFQMGHENLEFLTVVLIGLCAVFWLVFLMFGVVLLEGIVDKKAQFYKCDITSIDLWRLYSIFAVLW